MQIQLITKLIAQIKCGDITGTSVSSKAATQDQTQAVNKPFISTWNWKGTHPNDLSANVYHLSFFVTSFLIEVWRNWRLFATWLIELLNYKNQQKKKTEEKSLKLSLFLQRFNINLKYQFNSVDATETLSSPPWRQIKHSPSTFTQHSCHCVVTFVRKPVHLWNQTAVRPNICWVRVGWHPDFKRYLCVMYHQQNYLERFAAWGMCSQQQARINKHKVTVLKTRPTAFPESLKQRAKEWKEERTSKNEAC